MPKKYNRVYEERKKQYQDVTSGKDQLPENFLHDLTFSMLGHGFLDDCDEPAAWELSKPSSEIAEVPFSWLRFDRLPMHPLEEDKFDLMGRWQSVLSNMHTLHTKLAFILSRVDGETSIYVGAYDADAPAAHVSASQLRQSVQTHLTGAEITEIKDMREIRHSLPDGCSGIVTGIPSLRGEGGGKFLQTLGKVASGLSVTAADSDYAIVILADPVTDYEITDLIGKMFELQGDVHRFSEKSVAYSLAENDGKSTSAGFSVSFGRVLAGLAVAGACVGTGLGALAPMAAYKVMSSKEGGSVGGGFSFFGSKSRNQSVTFSQSTTVQYVDYTAKYCEKLIESNVRRLEKGRNLGFWNTGIYVLGRDSIIVDTVLGTLRSIYSGGETYIEPIRAFSCGSHEEIRNYIRKFHIVPLPVKKKDMEEAGKVLGMKSGWHIFGEMYESFSTAMTTEELSLASNLPRRDVPGLKTVKSAVKFSSNPPSVKGTDRSAELGDLIDMGAKTGMKYHLKVDELTRHALVVGLNGSGKTTTVRKILEGILEMDIPFLVMDPIKTDYLEWAIKYNRKHENEPGFKRIRVYMPGYENYTWYDQETQKLITTPLDTLQLNAYKPGAAKNVPVDIMGHLDSLAAILSSSMSMGDVLPMLLQEAMYAQAAHGFGQAYANSHAVLPENIEGYPHFREFMSYVEDMMSRRGYSLENKGNLTACMETRVNSLLRGWKADFFDAEDPLEPEELFENNSVICLYGITDNKDKALAMSLLLQNLREFRTSKYLYDEKYRKEVSCGVDRLMHFAVVEEAHRILMKPTMEIAGEGNPQAVVAGMFNEMLSEVRAYGQGLMIVDQYPSRLVEDAIKNTNIKMIHKIQALDDREMVGNCMGLNEEQTQMLAALEKGNIIISSEQDEEAMWVKVQR